jgi:hypothetical protein
MFRSIHIPPLARRALTFPIGSQTYKSCTAGSGKIGLKGGKKHHHHG